MCNEEKSVHIALCSDRLCDLRPPSQEDRRAAQKKASERFVEFLDEEYVSLGITHRSIWRDVRDSMERKAPGETDVLDDAVVV